jgi:hypothetical protein
MFSQWVSVVYGSDMWWGWLFEEMIMWWRWWGIWLYGRGGGGIWLYGRGGGVIWLCGGHGGKGIWLCSGPSYPCSH